MDKSMNNCGCTPDEKKNVNPCIECTVSACTHHSGERNFCTLDSIRVTTHEQNPTEIACTDCSSFVKK